MVTLVRSAPYVPVTDVEQAASHYESVLGFRRDYAAGSPPQFAIVSRDGLAIMLRLVDDTRIVPNERQGGTWDVFFWITGADALCAELRANGADVVYGPIVQRDYSMREFAVRDPNGYILGFGEPIDES
ncbi:MAG: VOC family protein [Acidobacteria bacterium]|nr:VOC family protein [Acidobacteriota bacterium]MBV9475483.1 VOC family protein [Acidobacteriota bacterium]